MDNFDNFQSAERTAIDANVSIRFLVGEYSTKKVFDGTAETTTSPAASPCPCAPTSLRLGLASLNISPILSDTSFNPHSSMIASICETSSPPRYQANNWIEACAPPVSEARGHLRSPNCIKVRRNHRQGARDNSLSNNTDTCNAFWSMEGVWAELQDLESTLDCLHEVKEGSADMLK